ncbi:MAG TPA: aldose 1-epimerase [Allosphingosinicella sp.]|nr:aldose 1-epimerase [Allosphingosinicella sp.]
MDQDRLLNLATGPLELALAPGSGGSIARFDYLRGSEIIPILRGVMGVPHSVLEAASFPLVPFCNRIRGGSFSFRGRQVTLARNLSGDPSPLHGQGWLSPWEVASRDVAEAELVFRHQPGEWPWAYEARQYFALGPTGLGLRLSCLNLSEEPMPCGLGQHPYFPCTPETRLDTEVAEVWTVDRDVLPVERVPAAGRYDLRDRLVCGQDLDNGFGGWGGSARLATPGVPFDTGLESPDAGYFQLYSPASGGFIVAEPVTHANAALNAPEEAWPGLGLRVLEPGEEMVLHARIGLAGDHWSP